MSVGTVAGRGPGAAGVLVVIPTWNEQASVGNVVGEVRAHGYQALVVDDGSTDRSAELAERAGATVLRLPVNLGVGGALRCGFRFAVTEGYTTVVQCDADGQHDPADIARLLEVMQANDLELVVGSRFAGGSEDRQVGFVRRLAMRRLAHIATRRTGTRITDATSGFRAIGGPLLGSFAASYPTEYLGDTIESLVRAGREGHRVMEVEVHMRPRVAGVSTASSVASAWYLVRVVTAVWLARFRPTGRRVVQMTLWERGLA
jgi:glycosyltransferase involved in cell wall biosynthesis